MQNYHRSNLIYLLNDHFSIPINTVKTGTPVVRKVTNTRTATILSGNIIKLPIKYAALPKSCSFSINAVHPIAINAIVNYAVKRICVVYNVINRLLKIPKNSRFATIRKYVN